MKDKAKLNFVITVLMFLCMMAVTGIGFLMKFVLIPGRERWLKYGKNVELYLFGMERHEWGTVHIIFGLVLLGLLALHIILHWKVILGIYRKLIPNQKARRIVTAVFIISSTILIVLPFVVNPEIRGLGREEGFHGTRSGHVEETGKAFKYPQSGIQTPLVIPGTSMIN